MLDRARFSRNVRARATTVRAKRCSRERTVIVLVANNTQEMRLLWRKAAWRGNQLGLTKRGMEFATTPKDNEYDARIE
jgi:hypothetical protein